MTQIISAGLDRTLRRALRIAPLLAVAAGGLAFYALRSDAHRGVGQTATQPIGFRHDLHVRGLGLECSFCHVGATSSVAAGMPPAATCLVCHEQLWRGTRALQPLHTSVEFDQPIEWQSLYALPANARFHHGVHAAAGVECATCHGEVASMPRTTRAQPVSMAWCLDCHRQVDDRAATRASTDAVVATSRLTDCTTCHY